MAQTGMKHPIVQKELEDLLRELDVISSDLTSYVTYTQTRQLFIKEWLSKSTLN
jgi:hypothetical protein